jgi:hypothetical protein
LSLVGIDFVILQVLWKGIAAQLIYFFLLHCLRATGALMRIPSLPRCERGVSILVVGEFLGPGFLAGGLDGGLWVLAMMMVRVKCPLGWILLVYIYARPPFLLEAFFFSILFSLYQHLSH